MYLLTDRSEAALDLYEKTSKTSVEGKQSFFSQILNNIVRARKSIADIIIWTFKIEMV